MERKVNIRVTYEKDIISNVGDTQPDEWYRARIIIRDGEHYLRLKTDGDGVITGITTEDSEGETAGYTAWNRDPQKVRDEVQRIIQTIQDVLRRKDQKPQDEIVEITADSITRMPAE